MERVPCDRVTFSIVEANPSRARVVPIPPGAAARLGPSDVMVALHTDFDATSETSGFISVGPSCIAQNPLLIWSRIGQGAVSAADSIMEWKVQASLQYNLHGLPSDALMVDLITKMLKGRATPAGGMTLASPVGDHSESALLWRLAGFGYAEMVSVDNNYA